MKKLELVGDSQVIPCLCLPLHAILFIHSDYINRNSTEHVFTLISAYTVYIYHERRRRQLLRSGRITQNIDLGYAYFQEILKYYRVCIARAPVNKSACEDSHTEFAMHGHLQNIQCLLRIDGSIMAGVFLTSPFCVVAESSGSSNAASSSL